MKNTVQLITYADRLGGGTLEDLHALLTGPLAGVFGAVHILPFYHPIDGSDAGFDPIDHTRVDPRLGDWSDIAALARDVEVMADVIVNHMSIHSPQFQDFSAKGNASAWNGLFLTLDTVFPNGAQERDLAAVYRPRPGLPLTHVQLANGEKRSLWTTFTPEQVDIDVNHPQGRAYLESILQALATHGVTMIRLDAVGYAIKKAGTTCFMLPETFDFIAEFAATLPESMRVRSGQGKWLMKRAMQGHLPDDILYRPKMGFVTPVSAWFRGALSGAAEALVTKSRLLDTGWFRQEALEKAVRDHKSGLSDNGRLIWQLVMLEKALTRPF